jgi:hypothetical protein
LGKPVSKQVVDDVVKNLLETCQVKDHDGDKLLGYDVQAQKLQVSDGSPTSKAKSWKHGMNG